MTTKRHVVTDEPMERVSDLPIDRLRSTLEEHPVQLAILFGSHATMQTHPNSDVDVAVEFDGIQPGDEGYNDALFGLITALAQTVRSDVDVVDVHTLGPDVASAVFEQGILILGDEDRFQDLGERLTSDRDDRPPAERFDEALRKIDEHLA